MIYYLTQQQFMHESIQSCTLQDCIDYCMSIDEISVDTETTGFDPHSKKILSIQLGDEYNQYFIEWETINPTELLPIFTNPNKTFLFHNAKFDLKFLRKHNLLPKNVYDTMLAEMVLTTGYKSKILTKKEKELPRLQQFQLLKETETFLALDYLAYKYEDVLLDKSIRGNILKRGITPEVIIYGAGDIKYLSSIKSKQSVLIKKWKLEKVLYTLENIVVKVLALMEYTGITLDEAVIQDVITIVSERKDKLVQELDEIVYREGTKDLPNPNNLTRYCVFHIQGNLFFQEKQRTTYINWSSEQQLQEVLHSFGMNVENTKEETLQELKDTHPIPRIMLDYRSLDKIESSFGQTLINSINPITGRVHSDIWQIVSTGRISSKNPNLLNIPSHGELAQKIRSAFIPQKGWKIVDGDYSAMELKIVAELSQDPLWIDAFNQGKDLHGELAAITFDIPIEDVRKPFPLKPDFTYRDVQKTINFGLIFGMSEFKLAKTLQASVQKAKELINKFFSVVPKVHHILEMFGGLGKSRGYIRTGWPYRRIRFFPEWKSYMRNPNNLSSKDLQILGSIERRSKNLPIQGDNANVIKKALILLQDKIDSENLPVNILLSIYDQVVCEVKEDFAEEWKVIQEGIMIEAAREVIKSIPVIVDCKITDCWTK